MKKILTAIFAMACIQASAQIIKKPVTLNAGTNGSSATNATYYLINGQPYSRGGYLQFNFSLNGADTIVFHPGDTLVVAPDSTVGIYYGNTQFPLLQPTVDTFFYFGDSTNKQVRNMTSLMNWFKTYAY